jgi:hypothetical protein
VDAGKELARLEGQASRHLLVLHSPEWFTVDSAMNPNGDLRADCVANRNGVIDQQDLGRGDAHATCLFSSPPFGGECVRAGNAEYEVVTRLCLNRPDLVSFAADYPRPHADGGTGRAANEVIDDLIRRRPAGMQLFFPAGFVVHFDVTFRF